MKDICFIIFTNENYFELLELTLKFVVDNCFFLGKKIYVISNKIPYQIDNPNVIFLESGTPFSSDGGHFGPTMTKCLNEIPEEYIFWLCDDYLVKSPIKKDRFDNLVDICEDLEADFISFSTQKHLEYFIPNWNKSYLDSEKYNFPKNCFYEIDNTVRHMYSVQPCIWKKKSLMKLLYHNPTLTLHQLDNTDIKNTKGEIRKLEEFYNFSFYEKKENFFDFGFKNFCYHYPPLSYHVDEKEIGSDFLLIDYIEIVRHGKFLNADVNSKKILKEILESESVKPIINKLKNFF